MSEVNILGDVFLCRGRRVYLYKRIIEFSGDRFEKDLVIFGDAVVLLPILGNSELFLLNSIELL